MIKSMLQIYQEVGKFECVGTETVEGQRASRLSRPRRSRPEGQGQGQRRTKNEAVRMVYLDPTTGLPARSIFAREGHLDKPIFKEVYTYPDDIEIEPPKVAK